MSKWVRGEYQSRRAAEAACKADLADAGFAAAHGGKTFGQFYGLGKKGANALQRCIQAKWKAASATARQATVNAVRSCETERTSMGTTAFVAKYGTKASAFGKCVSKLEQAQQG